MADWLGRLPHNSLSQLRKCVTVLNHGCSAVLRCLNHGCSAELRWFVIWMGTINTGGVLEARLYFRSELEVDLR